MCLVTLDSTYVTKIIQKCFLSIKCKLGAVKLQMRLLEAKVFSGGDVAGVMSPTRTVVGGIYSIPQLAEKNCAYIFAKYS